MTIALIAWAAAAAILLLTPVGLVLWFELYAFARRYDLEPLEYLAIAIGAPVDVWCNYTWCWWAFGYYPWDGLSWQKRTVTARITRYANDPAAGTNHLWGLAIALGYLNLRDPGHCTVRLDPALIQAAKSPTAELSAQAAKGT